MAVRVKGIYAKVMYADTDITAQIAPWLEVLKYTDHLDGDTADELIITLDDSQGLFSGPLYPLKGSALHFEFGYDTKDVFKSGKGFLISKVKIAGGGVTVVGGSNARIAGSVEITASGNLPGKGIHSKVSKAWTQTTLDAVAKDISQKHGLDLVFECDKKISLTRLDQFDKSDLKLIRELTEKYGLFFSFKAGKDKTTMVITDLDTLRSKPPTLSLPVGHCTSYNFKDSVSPNTKGRYTRYFDPIKKELMEFDYERQKANVKDKLAGATVETLDGQGQQDRAIEREALEVYAKKKDAKEEELTADITLPGNPSLLAGVVIELPEDEWMRYAGNWVVTKSTHTLNVSAGYQTSLEIKKYKN